MRGKLRVAGSGVVVAVLCVLLAGCTSSLLARGTSDAAYSSQRTDTLQTKQQELVLGFAQVGSESGWRAANTKSIKDSAAEHQVELKFVDADQQWLKQVEAIRSFIRQGVDLIAFSPVVEYGWDEVLLEAKSAGIPVVLMDRAIDSKDSSLYVTYMGSDFMEEGRKAGRWIAEKMRDRLGFVNIVELQGTRGSAPAIDRKKGFEEVIADHRQLRIVRSEVADYTREFGKEIMKQYLSWSKAENIPIDVLYSHNDDMTLGAIEAIEEAGLVPGKDIIIISFDGIKEALQSVAAGKINLVIECNPLLGPQLMKVAHDVIAGKSIPKRIVTKERIFTQASAVKELPNRKY
jgi:galactofuranose transport system substrate-binding protein